MTGTNHFLTGGLIGLTITNPFAAVPLAFLSHFVLDALPHFGVKFDKSIGRRPEIFTTVTRIDTFIALALLAFAFMAQPWLVGVCMLVALSPDFVWLYKFSIQEQFGKLPPAPKGRLSQFHKDIQRYEFKSGIYIELVIGVVLAAMFWSVA